MRLAEAWSHLQGRTPVRRGVVLLVLAVALVGLRVQDARHPFSYVIVERLFGHTFVSGTLAMALAAWGLGCVFARTPWFAICAASLTFSLASAFGAVGLILNQGSEPDRHLHAPGEARYEVLVVTRFTLMDEAYEVTVRQTRGLLSRQWVLGCTEFPEGIRWESPTSLVFDEHATASTLRVDPSDGRPLGDSPLGACQ